MEHRELQLHRLLFSVFCTVTLLSHFSLLRGFNCQPFMLVGASLLQCCFSSGVSTANLVSWPVFVCCNVLSLTSGFSAASLSYSITSFFSPQRSCLPYFHIQRYISTVQWYVVCFTNSLSSGFSMVLLSQHSQPFVPLFTAKMQKLYANIATFLQHVRLCLFLHCCHFSCSCADLGALLKLLWVSMFNNTCSLKCSC